MFDKGSKYASGSECARLLSIPGFWMYLWFWICEGSEYIMVTQGSEYVMRCAIWYHLHNLKNVKNTPGGVLILVKL